LEFREDSGQLQKLGQELSILKEKQSVQDRELSAIESQIQAIEKNQRSIVQQRTRYLESIARDRTVVSQLNSRLLEIASDRRSLTHQETILSNRYRQGREEYLHNIEILNRHVEIFESKEKEIEKIVADRKIDIHKTDGLKKNIEQDKIEQEQIQRKLTQLEVEERKFETEYRAALVSQEETSQEISEVERQHQVIRQSRQQIERELQEIENRNRTIISKLETAVSQRKAILEKQSNQVQSLFSIREQRSAALARKTILDDLEQKQEGIGIGAKEIINRSRTSHIAPWNDILGTVADLLNVEFSYAAVIEAALGERSQWIVTQNLHSLLDHLQAEAPNIQGRVTFIDSNHGGTWSGRIEQDFRHTQKEVASSETSQFSIEKEKGVIARADKLFDSENRHSALIESLLGKTWVVETLEDASRLAKMSGERSRFVTMQGELLTSKGVAVVGSIHSEDSLISRKSELRQIKSELTSLEQKISQESGLLNSMDSELVEIERHIEEVELSAQEMLEQRAVVREKLKRVQIEQEEKELLCEEKKRKRANLEHAVEKFKDHLETFEQTRKAEHSRLDNLQEQILAKEKEIDIFRISLKKFEASIQQERINLVQLEEQRKNSLSSFEKLEAEQNLRLQQSEEATRRLHQVNEQFQKSHRKVLLTESRLAEYYLSEQESELLWKRKNEEKQEWVVSRRHLRSADAELQKQRRTIEEAKMTIDMRLRNVQQQQRLLCERIEEEFQETLTEFVSAGESAVRSHLLAQQYEEIDHDANREIDSLDPSSDAKVILDGIPEDEKTKIREMLERQLKKLRKRIKSLGNVNTDSLDHLDELQSRYSHLKTTMDDLVEAKNHLNELVDKIDKQCKKMFVETFEAIRINFQDLFRRAFGGGMGDIVLEDKEDVLECGIDIMAKPPGKELKSISLMSGGEKTLTAFAMLLAIFRHRPSPYCILDEVDAALDEANVERMLGLLNEFKNSTQFVIITHKKPTMIIADLLYGVTMEEAGISKRLTVKFENVGENGEFHADNQSTSTEQAA